MDKKNINTLKKSVLATLAYYSALKTPLTLVQAGRYMVSTKYKACPVFRHGVQSPKLSEIRDILDELVKEGIATEQKGLYWLKSCSLKHVTCNMTKQIKTSVEKKSSYMKFIQWEKISQRKINLVRKALKIFRFVPGLRGLFVCGSVARKTSRRRSDIDFLILTDKNRVWTVRFFMTAIAFLLGKKTKNKKIVFSSPAYRPPACASPKTLARRASEAGTDRQFPVPRKNRRDKFCLNHYRSTAKLKLEPELQDLYSAEEYAGMINFYSDGNIENQFYSANKDWMAKFLPNFDFVKPAL
ncbi:MAG: nucleotidyltransferase domain-containing protein, partial [Candidatus Moranbacteria bacterium]|nr:nucleotidyltransferase domain-containing protein [Candidatus Moranbacteria bacterium]